MIIHDDGNSLVDYQHHDSLGLKGGREEEGEREVSTSTGCILRLYYYYDLTPTILTVLACQPSM
jgi:hypothetical protein